MGSHRRRSRSRSRGRGGSPTRRRSPRPDRDRDAERRRDDDRRREGDRDRDRRPEREPSRRHDSSPHRRERSPPRGNDRRHRAERSPPGRPCEPGQRPPPPRWSDEPPRAGGGGGGAGFGGGFGSGFGGGGRRRRDGGNEQDESKMQWGRAEDRQREEEEAALPDKEPEPDFGLSGALAAETNTTVSGVVLVHNEPPEARMPSKRWRLYVFKGGKPLGDPLHIHRQSCYLFGRERRVADVPTDHPSCSKQHAVLQFRMTEKEGADGMMASAVRPYLMDLGSTNGTYLNGERLEPERYYELLESDMLRFGNSSREYVLLHDQSAGAKPKGG